MNCAVVNAFRRAVLSATSCAEVSAATWVLLSAVHSEPFNTANCAVVIAATWPAVKAANCAVVVGSVGGGAKLDKYKCINPSGSPSPRLSAWLEKATCRPLADKTADITASSASAPELLLETVV